MCVLSMVSDPFRSPNAWPNWPVQVPFPQPASPDIFKPIDINETFKQKVTRDEFEALKQQVEDLKKLLEEARAEDIRDGNPDCEMEDKVFVIKKIAELVGVELGDVFPND